MILLDSRSLAILSILLDSTTPLTRSQIAEQLDITPRMVGYRLNRVGLWLDERNLDLVTKPHYGIIIEAAGAIRAKLKQELKRSRYEEIIWSAQERWKILVFNLLTEENPTILKRLQTLLGVSRPTLASDMDIADMWLKNHNLVLVRRPGYGVGIEGEEHKIREATLCLLLDNISESHLQSYIERKKKTGRSSIKLQLENCADVACYLEDLNLWLVASYLRNTEYKLDYYFTDDTNRYLTILLGITIQRLINGRFINHFPVDIKEIQNTGEYLEAAKLCSSFEKEFGISISNNEIVYIAINLLGAIIRPSQASITDSSINTIIQQEPLTITKDFLSQVSLHIHPIIRIDRRLIRNLAFHIRPVLVRLRYGLPVRNPLLQQIKSEYPYIFKVARKCSWVLEDRIGNRIPDDEIGYLVMHLAAAMRRLVPSRRPLNRVMLVCGAGMATVWLLVSKLKCLFPQINIKDVLSASEIPHNASYSGDVDLVISTVPLRDLGVPIIKVTPFLSAQDLSKIRAALESGFNHCSDPFALERIGPSLIELISVNNIRVSIHAGAWAEVVEEAGKPLLLSGAIEKEYILAMKDTIRRYGPYAVIMPGVVLLHARPNQGVNMVCISLITLANPIKFGHPLFDPVKVAFVLGATNEFEHINALQQLTSLLGDEKKINDIYEAKSKIEVLKIVQEHVASLDDVLLS
jgi:transcriptional antiterminator/mannitol/fructose-specific phosphotransferase system IIA component (Ntr-type)